MLVQSNRAFCIQLLVILKNTLLVLCLLNQLWMLYMDDNVIMTWRNNSKNCWIELLLWHCGWKAPRCTLDSSIAWCVSYCLLVHLILFASQCILGIYIHLLATKCDIQHCSYSPKHMHRCHALIIFAKIGSKVVSGMRVPYPLYQVCSTYP